MQVNTLCDLILSLTDWFKLVAMRYGVNKLEILQAKCSRRSSGVREGLKCRKIAAFRGVSQMVLIPTDLFILSEIRELEETMDIENKES